MSNIGFIMIGLFVCFISTTAYSQCGTKLSLKLTDNTILTGYTPEDFRFDFDDDTTLKAGVDLTSALPNRWGDDIDVFLNLYWYSFPSQFSNSDTTYSKQALYFNNSVLAMSDVESMIFQETIDCESTSDFIGNDGIAPEDTVWMNKPTVETCQISVFDSIRCYSDIDLFNYRFYSHSDSEETDTFMSAVKTLNTKLSQDIKNGEFRREFFPDAPESDEGRWLNILNLDDVENIYDQINKLETKMKDMEIVLILEPLN